MKTEIDEAMLPFSELMEGLSDHTGKVGDETAGFIMQVEKIKAGFPLQMDIQVDEDGQVVLGGSPPLYYFETSVMPVFHNLKITLTPM